MPLSAKIGPRCAAGSVESSVSRPSAVCPVRLRQHARQLGAVLLIQDDVRRLRVELLDRAEHRLPLGQRRAQAFRRLTFSRAGTGMPKPGS